MRTNIVLDDDLMREAARHARGKTKRAVVEEALATFIRVHEERKRRESYRDRLQSLDRKVANVRLTERPLDVLRRDRNR
jgi:Arc/MetJ family transcription regulator